MQTETQETVTRTSKKTAVNENVTADFEVKNEKKTRVKKESIISPETIAVDAIKPKRGRKPKPKTPEIVSVETPKPKKKRNKTYFGPEQEAFFVKFIQSTDQAERDRIFSQELQFPLTKMIESIIRRYQLFTVDEDFDETFNDAMSYLMLKSKYFDPTRNFKAYSFCGTVVKNYLILKRSQSQKAQERDLSYDWLLNDTDFEQDNDDIIHQNVTRDLFANITDQIQLIVKPEYMPLFTDKEMRVAYALLEILQHHDEVFKIIESAKFNKISSMYFIQEYTQLSPADVRDAMKLFREVYGIGRQGILAD